MGGKWREFTSIFETHLFHKSFIAFELNGPQALAGSNRELAMLHSLQSCPSVVVLQLMYRLSNRRKTAGIVNLFFTKFILCVSSNIICTSVRSTGYHNAELEMQCS